MDKMYQLSRLYKIPRPAVNWVGVEKMIADSPRFTIDTKNRWKEAILFLRKELGKNFWEMCKTSHPLYKIFDHNTGNVDYIIGLSNTLKKLRDNSKTYKKILGKILSEKKSYNEGLYFIEIARDLLRQEFSFELVQESKTKTPDIEIFHPASSTKFYIEVSRISEGYKRYRSYDQFEQILKLFLADGIDLPYGCK